MTKKAKFGRKKKVHLLFNENERKDYLLGFRKRKEARKRKVKEELEKQQKEEKKKIKLEQKDELRKMLFSQRTVPEIEHLIEPVTYELPEHTVTIAEVDINDQLQCINADIEKSNKMESEDFQYLSNSENEADGHEIRRKVDIAKKLKMQRVEAYRKSSAFAASKILQKKKDKKKAKQQKLLLKRESKKTKKNKFKKKKNK